MSGYAHGPLTALLDDAGLTADRLAAWTPFPTIADRTGWQRVDARLDRAELAAVGEADFPALTASLWQDYGRTGNRTRFEARYFTRREQLNSLVCLAGATGEISDALVDRLWALLEESAWWVPCHDTAAHDRQVLPQADDPVVDLFAAQTGAQLALVRHVLAPGLDEIAPLLSARIAAEVERRIITPYLARDDWWWLGQVDHPINNWNPWINLNTLIATLLVVQDPQRRLELVRRIVHSLDAYLADMPTDGGCTEGQGYWAVAASKVVDAVVILDEVTGGSLAATTLPQIVASARYPVAMHIADRAMVQHADGNARCDQNPQLLYRYGRAVDDTDLQRFALFLRDRPIERGTGLANLWDRLCELFDHEFHDQPVGTDAPYPAVSWFATTEVLAARERSGSPDGLFLAVKGGHNEEDHNHNDVGSFSIALDGRPLVIDAGVNDYTAQTFGPDRYALWTMQSGWHNLPRINGQDQQPGERFRATATTVSGVDGPDTDTVGFSTELRQAWGEAAGVESWQRELVLDRRADRIRLTDRWELSATTGLDLPLVCAAEPHPDGERTRIGDLLVEHPGLTGTVEVQPIPAGDRLEPTWGSQVWRLVLTPAAVEARGSWVLTFTRG